MSNRATINYSGFWDVPLAFVVWHKERQFLFWRGFFDDALGDYSDKYRVSELPKLSEDTIARSWIHLDELATKFIGEIQIKDITFDPMCRVWIDTQVIDTILAVE